MKLRISSDVVVGDNPVSGGQDRYHSGVRRGIHVHVGAVPYACAPQLARLLLHGGQGRLHRRAADAATGMYLPVCWYGIISMD